MPDTQLGKASGRSFLAVIAITGAAQFMAGLDNLVVTTALPVMRERMHVGLAGLEKCLHPCVRCLVTGRRCIGRSSRTKEDVRHGPRHLRLRFGDLRTRAECGRVSCRTGTPRHRWSTDRATVVDVVVRVGSRRAAQSRSRHLGCSRRAGDRDRSARWRRDR